MTRAISYFVILFLCLVTAVAHAAPPAEGDGHRPRIGLVLSGGGAKGLAHVGVIKVLEEAGIKPDIIVGTSMGAVVGSLYATGMSADQIEHVVDDLDWKSFLVDDPSRIDKTARRKAEDAGFLADLRLRVKDGEARLPAGVVKGHNVLLALEELLRPAQGITDFDKLPIRFRAVASDIETGDEVVLRSGDLVTALRASMAVPGAFPPVRIGGRLLVDGAIVNNVPISVAREMGADIVIVAAFKEQLKDADQLTSALSILNQSVDVMISRATRQQLALLRENDILITIDLGTIGSSSFDRVGETMPMGAEAARTQLTSLRSLGQRMAALGAPAAVQPLAPMRNHPIAAIRFKQRTPLSDSVLLARMKTRVGDLADERQLREDMARIYGLDLFDTVSYRIEDSPEGDVVVVTAQEAKSGTDYFRFGFDLANDFEGRSTYNFAVSFTKTAMNRLNGEWRTRATLGETIDLATEFYQPLDAAGRFYVRPFLYAGDRPAKLVDHGDELASARVTELKGGAELGINLDDNLVLMAGVEKGWGHERERTGTGLVPRDSFDIGRAYAGIVYDSFDNLNFPHHGVLASARYRWSGAPLGADRVYQSSEIKISVARSWGRNTVIGSVESGLTWGGQSGIGDKFTLGGPFRLTGYLNGGLSGGQLLLARGVYYRELARFGPSFLHFPLYAGASLEYGNVFNRPRDIDLGDMLWGGTLFVAMDTPLGPLSLGYGYSQRGEHAIFMSLGSLF
jgi:NTE family protein